MKKSSVREIILKNRRVKYTLEIKKVKNVNVRITPEKGLYVSAPEYVDIKSIEEYLKSNSSKILNAIDRFKTDAKFDNNKSQAQQKSKRTIVLNGRTVEYELQFKKIKRLNLSIDIQKGVRVSAPNRTSISAIEAFMRNNSDFIIKAIDKQSELSKNMPKPKKLVNGEYIYFLGEKKYLQIVPSTRNVVEINGNEIILFVSDADDFELKQRVIDDFLKNQCRILVTKMCGDLYPRFARKGISFPKEIRFRKMVSCWGNCRPQRSVLTFSTHLVQLPVKCIEAVICHEFTHFLHADHSKAFYAQLTEFMPDWVIYDKHMKELQKEIIFRK